MTRYQNPTYFSFIFLQNVGDFSAVGMFLNDRTYLYAVPNKSDLSTLVCSRAAKPHMESFGKRCSYKVPKTSTNIKLVTAIDRNGTETKRVQCEYCPKTHINVPVYNLHFNTGIFKTLTVTSVLIRTVTSTKMK